ncbi:MAG: transporter substrate-binding domain-containing protein [Kineosporiaceae bacterium]
MSRRIILAVVTALALSLAACSTPDRTPQIPTSTAAPAAPSTAPSSSATPPTCASGAPAALASYRPLASQPGPGAMPSGTLMAEVQKRGYLLVGTSSDTRLLSDRNASRAFEGFDIEMAKRVAEAIFGDSSSEHLRFRAISAGDRVTFVNNGVAKGGVDMIARAMTVNCTRWNQVAFSSVYFESTQQVLVRRGAKETTLKLLGDAKKKVCATNGSTSIASLAKFPGIQPVGVKFTTDCMALWQQGAVDAITGDDAILAGLTAQDPSAVVPGKENIEKEPYGLAVAKSHPEFAQFINGVLEKMRTDGRWQKAYSASGLATRLPDRSQPAPDFSRPLP